MKKSLLVFIVMVGIFISGCTTKTPVYVNSGCNQVSCHQKTSCKKCSYPVTVRKQTTCCNKCR